MAMHPHRVVKKTLRLDPDKLARLQKLLQTSSASAAVRQAIDQTLAHSEALQAARRIQRCGTLAWVILRQFVEQCLGLLEVSRVKSLGKPAIERRQQRTRCGLLALLLPEAIEAHGGP